MIQHIVLLKLKAGVDDASRHALLDGLRAMQASGAIPGIVSVDGGDNDSPEGKSHGFDWGFVVVFADAAARDAYLPHPDHVELARTLVRPIAEDVLVFDFPTS